MFRPWISPRSRVEVDVKEPDVEEPDVEGHEVEEPDVEEPDVEEPDVQLDVELDVEPDIAPDVAPAIEPDVAPNVEPNVAPNVEPDAAPDIEPDVAPDVEPDINEPKVDESGVDEGGNKNRFKCKYKSCAADEKEGIMRCDNKKMDCKVPFHMDCSVKYEQSKKTCPTPGCPGKSLEFYVIDDEGNEIKQVPKRRK